MTDPASFKGLSELLAATERLPVVFLGHGSPMNALPPNPHHQAWRGLGAQFGSRWPRPSLILCVSAHWLTQGWWLTAMAQPETLHDFGGFPEELFQQQYPAPGWPQAAAALAKGLRQPSDGMPLQLAHQGWGLDHGAWGVLKPMFPQADIPVIQLSLDLSRPAAEHGALGRQLAPLRERGVLIVASGNIVHNLRSMHTNAQPGQVYDWALEFDDSVARCLQEGRWQELLDYQKLGSVARLSHPSADHFLPLLYAAGAARPDERPQFFNTGFQAGSISMRSAVWG